MEHPETWLAAIAYAGRDVKAYGTEVKSPKGYIRAKYAKFLAEGIPAGKFPEPEAVKPVQARRHAPDHGKREAEGPPPELPPVDLPLPREYWEYVCDRSIPGNFVTKGRRWMEEHPEYKPGTPEYEAKVREVRAMRASA